MMHINLKNNDSAHQISILLEEVIFPIIRRDITSKKFQLFGTGFFIADQGLFMTAKHVLRGFVEKDTARNPTGIFPWPANNGLKPIKKVFWKNNSDVAVALLSWPNEKNAFLKLSSSPCRKGDLIYTYAFPASQIEQMEDLSQRLPVPEFFSGTLEEEYPRGRDKRMLPNPCWKTNLPIQGGASGGPVFNQNGKVIGINNSSLNIDPSCSFISTLDHIMDLEITDIDIPDPDLTGFEVFRRKHQTTIQTIVQATSGGGIPTAGEDRIGKIVGISRAKMPSRREKIFI